MTPDQMIVFLLCVILGALVGLAAAVLPIVAVEVRKAKAEALRDAADSVHDNMATPYCRPCHREDADLLHTIADQIEAGDQA